MNLHTHPALARCCLVVTTLLATLINPAYAAEGTDSMKFGLDLSAQGEGYVWDADSATMTMDGFSLTKDGLLETPEYLIEFDTGDTPVTIVLKGKNTLGNLSAGDDTTPTGSIKAKNLHITGDGVLTLRGQTSLCNTDPGSSLILDGGAQLHASLVRAENITVSGEKTLLSIPGNGSVEAVNALTVDGGSICSGRIEGKGGIRAYGIPRDGATPSFQPMTLRDVNVRHGMGVQNVEYACAIPELPELEGRTFYGSIIAKGEAYMQDNTLVSVKQKVGLNYYEIIPHSVLLPNDISGHWAYDRIIALCVPGLVRGYADRTFRPERKVTRAEFAKMLFAAGDKLGGVLPEKTEDEFPDLQGSWARGMINGLAGAGVIDKADYPNGFSPDTKVTRAEAVKMLMRKLGYKREENAEITVITPYPDVQDEDTKYYAGMATTIGAASGNTDGTFAPDKILTRAEATAFIYNALYN